MHFSEEELRWMERTRREDYEILSRRWPVPECDQARVDRDAHEQLRLLDEFYRNESTVRRETKSGAQGSRNGLTVILVLIISAFVVQLIVRS